MFWPGANTIAAPITMITTPAASRVIPVSSITSLKTISLPVDLPFRLCGMPGTKVLAGVCFQRPGPLRARAGRYLWLHGSVAVPVAPGMTVHWCRARLPGLALDSSPLTRSSSRGEERPVAGALGVGAGLACLGREWRAVPDLAGVDAAAGAFVMGRSDVGDDQPSLG
jgi:hypothetical protein